MSTEILVTGNSSGAQSRTLTVLLPSPVGDPVGTPGQFWAAGDGITVAGGTGTPSQLTVTDTTVVAATLVDGGSGGTPGAALVEGTTGTGSLFKLFVTISGTGNQTVTGVTGGGGLGYLPNDTITLAGGTGTPVELQVDWVGVGMTGWTLTNAGTGGMPGTYTGAAFELQTGLPSTSNAYFSGTIGVGGDLTALSVFLGGWYGAPETGVDIPLVGHGLVGATVNVSQWTVGTTGPSYPLGISILNAGDYTVPPTNPVSQASTSGSGSGAMFDLTLSSGSGSIVSIDAINEGGDYTTNPMDVTNEPVVDASSSGITGAAVAVTMGVLAVEIAVGGSYTVPPTNPVGVGTTTGIGSGALFS